MLLNFYISGNLKADKNMLSSLKEDNVLLNNDLEKEFNNRIEDEINFNNAVAIYKLLQTFKT